MFKLFKAIMFFSVLYMGLSSSSLLASGSIFGSVTTLFSGINDILDLPDKAQKLEDVERASKKGKVLATIAKVVALAGIPLFALDIYTRHQRAKRNKIYFIFNKSTHPYQSI